MNTDILYRVISGVYDLLDVVYFRCYENSPRKVVFDAINENDRVLDLCTGTATNALKIAQAKPSTKVVGIDLSKNMLHIAKKKVEQADVSNISLRYMDATKIKFKDHCFDKVLLSLVIHEVDDRLTIQILDEVKRVLKQDGELIVTEWEKSKDPVQKVLFAPIDLLEPKPYKTIINTDLNEYFTKRGFTVIEESHCDYTRVYRLGVKREVQ